MLSNIVITLERVGKDFLYQNVSFALLGLTSRLCSNVCQYPLFQVAFITGYNKQSYLNSIIFNKQTLFVRADIKALLFTNKTSNYQQVYTSLPQE